MQKLYGYIANTEEDQPRQFEPLNDAAIDETWKYVIPAGFAGAAVKKALPYLPYAADIWAGRNLLFHKPFDKMTKEEYNAYGKIGRGYYQNYLQKNPVNIKNYGMVSFGRHNKGKDKTYNYEQYPFLRKQLETAEKENFFTNNKNEPDRNYDYFKNEYKDNLYHYLIENIDNRGLKYKMMKNKTKGE